MIGRSPGQSKLANLKLRTTSPSLLEIGGAIYIGLSMEAALFRQPRFFPAEYTLSWQAGNAASSGSLRTSVHVRVAPCATLGTPDAHNVSDWRTTRLLYARPGF